MRAIALVVVILLTSSCHDRSQQAAREPTTPGSAPQRTQPPPARIGELADAVKRVPLGKEDRTHADIIAALAELAEVVRAHSPSVAAQIDETTAELRKSEPGERTHTDLVKSALRLALDGFAQTLTRRQDPAARAAYVEARRASAAISADAPLVPQTVEVTAALRAITNVAALLAGGTPVFPEIAPDDAIGYDPGQLVERAKRASEAVSELAKERRWQPAGERAARALHALADVLEVAPMNGSAEQRRLLVTAVRYEALEIEREGALTLERTDRLKSGLLACVEGFERLPAGSVVGAVPTLVAAARTAVDAIDETTSFVFQRDVIQEALRATVDAYVVLAMAPVPTELARRR